MRGRSTTHSSEFECLLGLVLDGAHASAAAWLDALVAVLRGRRTADLITASEWARVLVVRSAIEGPHDDPWAGVDAVLVAASRAGAPRVRAMIARMHAALSAMPGGALPLDPDEPIVGPVDL